jgi:8-oxo-dGTP pyrophosphatase MutT (NUDIX family)
MSFKDNYRTKISTSYGIIVYTYVNNEIKFLMTLRRDTFCYESIIRGLYSTPEMLAEYISHITKEEQERILKYDFDLLWKDLWVSTKRRLYRLEYRKAQERFLKNYDTLISLVKNMTVFDQEQWEFPKGKMFSEENSLQCALREFEEETNISKHNIMVVKNAGTFDEAFYGNDQRKYQSIYYLGIIKNGVDIPFTYNECPHNIRSRYVSDEVMSIEWLSYEEAYKRSSPTKKIILDNVCSYLFGINQ